jgi:single-stranded-DNA-specific exonuclease
MDIFVGDRVDLLFNLDVNEYNGRRSVQLIVRDIRLCQKEREDAARARARFEEIWEGAPFSESENVYPSRDDFAAVYTLISRTVRAGCDTLSHRSMLSRLSAFGHGDIGYIKLKIIIRVFQELNLVGIEEPTPENYRFEVRFSTKKTDLDKSSWLHRLRSQIR